MTKTFAVNSGSSSGGTPASPDTSVQFNDGGSFGGDAGLTYDKTANTLLGSGTGDYIALTALNTTFSASAINGLHFGQYATGEGFIFAGNFLGEIDFNTNSTISVFSPSVSFNHSIAVAEEVAGGFATFNNIITSNASALTEVDTYFGVLSINIGTGFSQSGGPAPRAWFSDYSLQGPIAVQPHLLNGLTMLQNNYYNGSPADSASGGLWVVTKPAAGGNIDATHAAATTYANDVGVGVTGYSTGGAVGWTTAFMAGGFGSGWHESGTASKIGTGLHVRDYTTYGILIDNPSGSPTTSISADGLILGGTIQPTYYYKSTDGSEGISVDITAEELVTKTITVKDGIVTDFDDPELGPWELVLNSSAFGCGNENLWGA